MKRIEIRQKKRRKIGERVRIKENQKVSGFLTEENVEAIENQLKKLKTEREVTIKEIVKSIRHPECYRMKEIEDRFLFGEKDIENIRIREVPKTTRFDLMDIDNNV